MTIRQLSAERGVSGHSIPRVEEPRRMASSRTAAKLAEALRLPHKSLEEEATPATRTVVRVS